MTYLPQSTKNLPSEENLDKLNLYGEKLDELLRKYDIAANRYCLTNAEITELTDLLSDRSRNKLFENDRQRRFLEDCRIIQNEVSEKLSLQKRITPVKNRLKHVTQSLSEKNILTDEISAILKSLDSGNELLISRINSFNKQEYNPKKSVYDENILIQDIKDILVPRDLPKTEGDTILFVERAY